VARGRRDLSTVSPPIPGAMQPRGPMGESLRIAGRYLHRSNWPPSVPWTARSHGRFDLETSQSSTWRPRSGSIASRLDNDGERSWSRMLLKALGHPSGHERITSIGHALAILLRHGPLQRPSIGVSTDELEQLLLDTMLRDQRIDGRLGHAEGPGCADPGHRVAGPTSWWTMTSGATLTCDECGLIIDATGPAVCNDRGASPHWVPFVEDLRSDPQEHRHGRCFAQACGVDALNDAVHQEDLRRR
jgi:hypothetical protein